MPNYIWDFSLLLNYIDLWLHGVAVTLLLSVGVIFIGTVLGVSLVIGLKSRFWIVRQAIRLFIDIFRAIPALVLLGTLYFCLPIISGIAFNAPAVALMALSLNLSPFAAECIRAGIDSVPTVQYESARIVGFRGWNLIYYIIGPQAVRRILPSLSGQWVTSLKMTSLAATIGVPEIWHVTGEVVTDTALPLEARLAGAVLYVLIILPPLWGVSWLERIFNVQGLGRSTNQ